MAKHSFKAQRYYLKWLAAFPLLGLALIIEFFISQLTDSDVLFYLSCALVMGGLMTGWYFAVDKVELFWYEGQWWEEDGVLRIRLRNRTYEVTDVTEVMGGDPNIFLYRYAYLLIEGGGVRVKIFGQTLREGETFRDSELLPLFQRILELWPGMVPKTVLGADIDDWYVRK